MSPRRGLVTVTKYGPDPLKWPRFKQAAKRKTGSWAGPVQAVVDFPQRGVGPTQGVRMGPHGSVLTMSVCVATSPRPLIEIDANRTSQKPPASQPRSEDHTSAPGGGPGAANAVDQPTTGRNAAGRRAAQRH